MNAFIGMESGLHISILKEDNGWLVHLNESLPIAHQYTAPAKESLEDTLDNVVDAIRTFFSAIHEDDDSWRGEGNKEKMRKAVKALFPQVAALNVQPPPVPREERRVFEDKAKLLKYIEQNL